MKIVSLFLSLLFSFHCYSEDFLSEVKDILNQDPSYQEVIQQEENQNSFKTFATTTLFIPRFDINVSKIRNQSPNSVIQQDFQLAQLQMRYSLFSFGSDYHQYQESKHTLSSFKANKVQTLIERERVVVKLLLDYIFQNESLNIQKNVLDLNRKLLKTSRLRYKKGSLSINDYTKVQIDFSNAESEYLIAKQNLTNVETQLIAYKGEIKQKSFPWTKFFKKEGISKLQKLSFKPEEMPVLKKFKDLKLASEHESKKEYRKHFGEFSLNYAREVLRFEDSNDQYGWRASIVYTLPLFENWGRKLRADQAEAKARVADYTYQFQKRLLKTNNEQALKRLKSSFKNFNNRMNTLKASKQLFTRNQKMFKRGQLSVNDLFVEQDRLLKTKILTNQAIYDLHLSYLDYSHALGRPMTTSYEYFN